jgi:Tripartite tricarboxylate transporter family receptor
MKLGRRTFLHLAAGAAALPAVSRMARAQAYPSRPVRIIVGFPAGGATDIQARLMGQWLSERLGQQFVIENRAGASGNIGTEAVAKAPADGYTLLQIVTPHAINAVLYTNLSFVASVGPGHDDPRVHRLCQGQPGQGQLRVGRPRHAAKHCLRTLQDDDRGESGARPV